MAGAQDNDGCTGILLASVVIALFGLFKLGEFVYWLFT